MRSENTQMNGPRTDSDFDTGTIANGSPVLGFCVSVDLPVFLK